MERCLAHSRHWDGVWGEHLVLLQKGDGTDLVDFPGEALPSLGSRMGVK